MSMHISFHSNSLHASALEEEPAEEGATPNVSLLASESMLLDPCPKLTQSSNFENSASTTPWDTTAQEKGAVDHQGTLPYTFTFKSFQSFSIRPKIRSSCPAFVLFKTISISFLQEKSYRFGWPVTE